MPGTFHQLHIRVVFAVKGRENLVSNNWKEELHKYIAGIIEGKGQKSMIVNGNAWSYSCIHRTAAGYGHI